MNLNPETRNLNPDGKMGPSSLDIMIKELRAKGSNDATILEKAIIPQNTRRIPPNENSTVWKTIAFTFGVVALLIVLLLVFSSSHELNDSQKLVVRVLLGLSAAGIIVVIPGSLEIKNKYVQATGAIVVFVIIYFFNPKT